jgi:hypothetical protein
VVSGVSESSVSESSVSESSVSESSVSKSSISVSEVVSGESNGSVCDSYRCDSSGCDSQRSGDGHNVDGSRGLDVIVDGSEGGESSSGSGVKGGFESSLGFSNLSNVIKVGGSDLGTAEGGSSGLDSGENGGGWLDAGENGSSCLNVGVNRRKRSMFTGLGCGVGGQMAGGGLGDLGGQLDGTSSGHGQKEGGDDHIHVGSTLGCLLASNAACPGVVDPCGSRR